MSKYTTEVRYICETMAGLDTSVGFTDVLTTIEKSAPKIFSMPYPIFDEEYRAALQTKILLHYYTREIAYETVPLWFLKLGTKMGEIMPYYNQLYRSALIEFDPFNDVNLKREYTKTGDQEEDETREEVGTSKNNSSTDATKTGNTTLTTDNKGTNTNTITTDGNTSKTENATTGDTEERTINGKTTLTGTKDTVTGLIGKVDTTNTNNETSTTADTRTDNTSSKTSSNISTTAKGESELVVDRTNHLKTNDTTAETINYNRDHKDRFADTPQGSLSGLLTDKYLTNARLINEENLDAKDGTFISNKDETLGGFETTTKSDTETTTGDTTVTNTGTVKNDGTVTKNGGYTDVTNTKNDTTEKETSSNTGTDEKTDNVTRAGTNEVAGSGTSHEKADSSGSDTFTGDEKGSSNSTETMTSESAGANSLTGNKKNKIKNLEDYIESLTGKQGTTDYSTLLMKFRQTFLNIDMMIIDELNDLFFNLY